MKSRNVWQTVATKPSVLILRCAAIAVMSLQTAGAADAYPVSPELVAAQSELDVLRALGTRDQLSAELTKRLDAAISKRNDELDRRNEAWRKADGTSVLKSQDAACTEMRHGMGNGKKPVDYLEKLHYAGFSSDETIDVVLWARQRTPQIGKSVKVAFCILGLPLDSVRRQTKDSQTVMLVYPSMFVHTEDGIVTSWSDR